MKQCDSMDEVRDEIDQLDRQIVDLLAERLHYIEQAGHIKQDRNVIRDEARIDDVIAKVRVSAAKNGTSEDLAETVFRAMIEWCIDHEFKVFDARHAAEPKTRKSA